MQTPMEIRFHQMDPSPSVEARIRAKMTDLDRFSDRITSCRVVVEKDHRQHRKGNLFRVSIDVSVPGKEIVANRKGPKDQAHEDIQVAIRDAFNALVRQLEDHVHTRRGKTKTHEVPPHGEVKALDSSGDFGFIAMHDGQEVYFHRNSVANGAFAQLGIGDEVRVVIAEGEGVQGAQASTVHPVGKHEDHVHTRRGKTKTHEVPPHGEVKAIDSSGDFGFIAMHDGQEVYFHRNSVANGAFAQLGIGDEVRVVIAEGEGVQGAQASTVHPVGKHHVQDPKP